MQIEIFQPFKKPDHYPGFEPQVRAYYVRLRERLSSPVTVRGAGNVLFEEYNTPEWQECLHTPGSPALIVTDCGCTRETYAKGNLECRVYRVDGVCIQEEYITYCSDGTGSKHSISHDPVKGITHEVRYKIFAQKEGEPQKMDREHCPLDNGPSSVFAQDGKEPGEKKIHSHYYVDGNPILSVPGRGGPISLWQQPSHLAL